jgi:thiol-disulfide isomerase/thioredoxin
MLKIITLLSFLTINIIAMAQKTYTETIEDNGTKIIKGMLSKEVLQYEPKFTWFAANEKGYVPNAATVNALKINGSKIQILAFGGTWCEDTQNIIPKFYALLTAAGFNQSQLTLWGTDRAKKTYGNLAEALGITNVPTFIIMQGGKELGRVIEYGKTGQWDKEIGEIVAAVK